jgi:hypothetical protein
MIEIGGNFRLQGVPDVLVTLALLYIGALALQRGMGRISIPTLAGKAGAAINPILQFAWRLLNLVPGAIMAIAALALIASTLPTALGMIGL